MNYRDYPFFKSRVYLSKKISNKQSQVRRPAPVWCCSLVRGSFYPKADIPAYRAGIHNNSLNEPWNLFVYPEDYKYSSFKFCKTVIDDVGLLTYYKE